MRAQHRPVSRSAAVVLLGLAVLLLHLMLLGGLLPLPAAPGRPVSPALQVRTLAVVLPPAATAAPPPAPPRALSPPAPRKVALKPAAAEPTPAAAPPAVPPPAPAGDAPWPVYATRLPAAAELHYRLQRGDSVGHARLQWQPGDADYALRLDTTWPGQAPRGAASRGLLDAEGVAPVRHTELQRSRETRAANFQREAGRITFSGPQLAYALRPGAQDRLSWLIQLPAIVEADTTLARPGAQVLLFVVGTRGDAEAWRFEVQGHEPLQLPAGAVAQALRLLREPTRPYDTRVEVWLDPARQHLPVRALFTTLPGGAPLQMELARADAADLEIGAVAPR